MVWDHYAGMPGMRMMADTVAMLGAPGRELRDRLCFLPMTQPGELERAFAECGLVELESAEMTVRMDYADFDDFWAPIAAGEGLFGKYVEDLDVYDMTRATRAVRDAYEAGRPDGPRSFPNIALAVKGIAP